MVRMSETKDKIYRQRGHILIMRKAQAAPTYALSDNTNGTQSWFRMAISLLMSHTFDYTVLSTINLYSTWFAECDMY